jgi:hypothetical protein
VKARHVLITVGILYLVALAVRLVPLATTPLPYNVDSLLETRMASDIVHSGGLAYPTNASYADDRHSTITPLYNIFLAASSVVVGMEPVRISPLLVPLLTSITVVAVFMIVMKMTKNKHAAMGAGVFLALSGTYVAVTLAPWKEAFGLLFLPVALYLYVNREDDIRLRALAVLLLALMPLMHHLVTAVAYLMVTFITLIPMAQRALRRRVTSNDKLDVGILGSLWAFAAAYYFISRFNRTEFFRPDSGMWLFASVFAVMLIGGIYAARRTATRLYLILPIPLVALGVFAVNYFVPIFPFTTGTNRTVLLYLLPYIILIYPLLLGFALVLDSSSKYRVFLIALFLAPFTIIVFAFLWGLNPTTSYPMIVRTFDFLDFGIAIAVGIGLAYMLNKLRRRSARAALGALFVVTCIVTTPIAFSTQKMFKVQHSTFEYETEALGWVREKNAAGLNLSTDMRLHEIGHNLYDLEGDFFLPYAMQKEDELIKNRVCVAESQWTHPPGAEMDPLDAVVISKTSFESIILHQNDIIGCGGPADNRVYVMLKPG